MAGLKSGHSQSVAKPEEANQRQVDSGRGYVRGQFDIILVHARVDGRQVLWPCRIQRHMIQIYPVLMDPDYILLA